MNRNKKQLELPSRSHSISLSSYFVQFHRSSPCKNKRKVRTIGGIDQFSGDSSKKRYGQTLPTQRINTSPKLRQPLKNRQKQIDFRVSIASAESQVIHGFPSRQKKTNQHQLFKILAKLQYHQSKRKRVQELSHRLQQPFIQQESRRTHLRPNARPKPTLHWVKQRYCANRDKDNGMFPFSSDLLPRSIASPAHIKSPLFGDS